MILKVDETLKMISERQKVMTQLRKMSLEKIVLLQRRLYCQQVSQHPIFFSLSSLRMKFTHVHQRKIISPSISCWMMSWKYWPIRICFHMEKGATRHQVNIQQSYHCENIISSDSLMLMDALPTTLNTCFVLSMQLRLNRKKTAHRLLCV